MEALVWVVLATFSASILTFFCGFGLGTLLLPVMTYFFPVELAVFGTAVVHLCNGLFKVGIMFQHLTIKKIAPFILAALPSAWLGAVLLNALSDINLYSSFSGKMVSLIAFILGILLILLAFDELVPKGLFSFIGHWPLWLGGLLSGFFGGISGTQGALRSAFLIKLKLTPNAYVAAGSFIALSIDLARLPVYYFKFRHLLNDSSLELLLLSGASSAMLGALVGKYILKKMTLSYLTKIVGTGLMLFGFALITGLLP